jgi:polar amino acid transport system substrate-binding protein
LEGDFIRRFFSLGYFAAFAFVIISTFASGLAAYQTVSEKDLTYITEQFPPYNFQKDGRLQGISVDLLEKAWEIMGESLNRTIIELLPWTEGYQRTLGEEDTVLFSTARLPEREQLFKWAGPIGPFRNVLLAKRDRNISVTNSEDLKKYKIGALKDDSAVQMLLNQGLKMEDLVLKTSSKPLIEMLQNESIDAWAYGDTAGIWLIQNSGLNTSDYRTAYILGRTDYYYAFNRETPDALVQSFQQALDSVKGNKDKEGVSDYEKIIAAYIPAML